MIIVVNINPKVVRLDVSHDSGKVARNPQPTVFRDLVTPAIVDTPEVPVLRCTEAQEAVVCGEVAAPDAEVLKLVEQIERNGLHARVLDVFEVSKVQEFNVAFVLEDVLDVVYEPASLDLVLGLNPVS